MNEPVETTGGPERCFLVGVQSGSETVADTANLVRELAGLAGSLGLVVAGSMIARLRERNAAILLGSGKADEIVAAATSAGADSILFDHVLTPVQQRNWETLSGLVVYDRSELILRIFSSRALTREAGLQVELARLVYSLPRLAHSYEELSRQRGGRYGTKGSGEQKIELDRRKIERRIHEIKEELKGVRTSRDVRRRRRERADMASAAVVGYTNAGKSSILNALTRSSVLVEDKLFATLDPTTRRMALPGRSPGGAAVLLTDTVGFVRNLPHGLVEAFKATLEEAADADLLVHVVDASDPEVEEHMETTRRVLAEIGAGDRPAILVLNKTDLVDEGVLGRWKLLHPDGYPVSATRGEGIEALREGIARTLRAEDEEMFLRFPHEDYGQVGFLYREALVFEERSGEDGTVVHCRLPARYAGRYERFRIRES